MHHLPGKAESQLLVPVDLAVLALQSVSLYDSEVFPTDNRFRNTGISLQVFLWCIFFCFFHRMSGEGKKNVPWSKLSKCYERRKNVPLQIFYLQQYV